ncbi:component of SufBCD complex [Nioella sp.]|uniref:component of SufBCD complex n=1 Tax=Nioella sp. TaxID=1912091 RepID=UPI003A89EBEC
MDFLELATEVIDLRSFSNLWYWIALAALWSTASHWIVGVPFDMVTRARRGHERSIHDMRVLAEVNVNRILAMVDLSGVFAIGFLAFLITGLAVLGWGYGVEFCQAVFLLMAPMTGVAALNVRTAHKLRDTGFEDLGRRLRTHRMMVQMIGMVSIFITAFWGMWTNLHYGALGL